MPDPRRIAKKWWIVGAAVAAVAVVAVGFALTGGGGAWKSALKGTDGASSIAQIGGDSGSTTNSSPKAVTTKPGSASGTNANPSDPGSGGGDQPSADGPSAPNPSDTATKPADSNGTPGDGTPGEGTPTVQSMTVRILWWNDTRSKAPENPEVIVGTSSFKPDVAKESQSGALASLVIGRELTLVVYPDGPDGKKIVVPIQLNSDMVPDSDQDAIHVEVSDANV
ncbi:MAG: hypothetical protein Q8K89_02760, partial [Actinomycetota bacterium]|nr:hypothetical protein [Actinomycetota bacterium]